MKTTINDMNPAQREARAEFLRNSIASKRASYKEAQQRLNDQFRSLSDERFKELYYHCQSLLTDISEQEQELKQIVPQT